MKKRRFIAWFIDYYVAAFLGFFIAQFIARNTFATHDYSFVTGVGIVRADYLFFATYFIAFVTLFIFKDLLFKNQSLGRKIMKIEVINDYNNLIPKKTALILRNLILIFIFPIELYFLLFDSKRVGDEYFKTKVLKKERR